MYAELLNDYLNFFLPITEREVNFPCFANQTQQTLKPVHSTFHRLHSQPSLFKRVIQKSSNPDGDLASILTTQNDRVGEMKKIDTFLCLINELLILPFTDISTQIQTISYTENTTDHNTDFNKQTTLIKKTFSPSSSPSKYDDCYQHNLCNLEIVFALAMILKHSHFFSNAFQIRDYGTGSIVKGVGDIFSKKRAKFMSGQLEFPLDELRK